MKYKIKTDNFINKSIYNLILENRNLTKNDVDNLLYPTIDFLENPYKIKNMAEGIQLFISEVDKGAKIGIVPDPDADGYTSSALTYLFLINECRYDKNKIELFFHDKKQHGLSDDKLFKAIKKSDIDFLIVPDAGTNDIKQIKDLMKCGKKVLLIDHHIQNDKSQNTVFHSQDDELIGVIVNNMLDKYSNKLSGVGVVWKMLSAMTEDELIHYLDLVAIGMVADSMEINDLEARYIVNKGLNNINNEFIKELAKDSDLSDDITPTDVSFKISNKINGVIRFGTTKEKKDLFRALIGEKDEIEYKPRKSKNNPEPQIEIQSLQKAMVRISKSIKNKQDKVKKECIKLCEQYVKDNNIDDNKCIVIIDEDGTMIDRRITGLIAMGLVDIYKKSVVLIAKDKDKYTGSTRGYNVDSLKNILESTDICKILGHDNANGIEVETKDIKRLVKRVDKVFEEIETDSSIEVDCELNVSKINLESLKEVLSLEKIWHQHCNRPLFLIKGYNIDSKDVRVPYPTLMTFKVDGIECKKEFCSKVFQEDFLHINDVKFGKPSLECDLLVEIGYDDYSNKPCFLLKYADTRVVKNTNKKDNNCPF